MSLSELMDKGRQPEVTDARQREIFKSKIFSPNLKLHM